jgi:hypothetical protein
MGRRGFPTLLARRLTSAFLSMSSFSVFIQGSLATEFDVFGETVTYSRPGNLNISPLANFTITAVVSTGGGEYTNPMAPLIGEALVRVQDIPQGPQKGDVLTPSNPNFAGRTFRVQEIFMDVAQGYARLKIRWPGAQ